MFAIISNEELEKLGQLKIKQLKNRYNDPSMNRAFIVGVDRSKMKLFDVSNQGQNLVNTNQQEVGPGEGQLTDPYDKFSDFKV